MQHLEALNAEQKEAALHTTGPLLIIAGAGAGKTKTITHRILHLIKRGARPSSILAITFTNKAAKEMRERIQALLAPETAGAGPRDALAHDDQPFMSTFHALGVHILKAHGERIGIGRRFTILDKSDALALVKEAVQSLGLDPKQFEPAKFSRAISRQKGELVAPGTAQAGGALDFRSTNSLLPQVWVAYEKLLAKQNALDFDDLLTRTVSLLQNHDDVREYYQKRWQYIHIDEYQDTNAAQYEMTRLLVGPEQNICVVGDADQTIYSWRGANIRNILEFERDYPGAKVVLLEQNYRSTQTILGAANAIIAKNKERKEKNLFTKNKEGERIAVYEAYDENDEARHVAQTAKDLIASGIAPRDIAVLYRANFQSRALEEAFLTLGVPYQVLGTRFFDRKEIKDLVCFLKAALNPNSQADIKRIFNVPPRGIGKTTILKVFADKRSELSPTIAKRVEAFYAMLEQIHDRALSAPLADTLKYILDVTGIEKTLREGTEEDRERLENLRELVTLATKYTSLEPEQAVEAFLTEYALATDQDSLERDEDAVKLMTVHASKGLEFPYVFITGLEQGLFPHEGFADSKGAEREEEERRLFYVALTRAEERVYLSHASLRTIFGSKQMNVPSEFLTDIDDAFLEHAESQQEPTISFFPDF